MAWTTPETWTHLELVDATKSNLDLRDNLNWLKTRPWAVDTAAAPTILVGTPTAMTGLSTVVTCTGGNVLMMFNCSFSGNLAGSTPVTFQWRIDAVQVGSSMQMYTAGANLIDAISMYYITSTPPTVGARTFTIYWNSNGANTITATNNTPRLIVMELF